MGTFNEMGAPVTKVGDLLDYKCFLAALLFFYYLKLLL